jgi:hypothetical protein
VTAIEQGGPRFKSKSPKPMKIYVFLLLLLATGCSSTQLVRLDTPDPKHADVAIHLKGEKGPSREYVVVAYVQTSGSIWTNKKQLMKAFKRNAAAMNADAIVQVNYFYIPHAFSSLPAVDGVAVKYVQ